MDRNVLNDIVTNKIIISYDSLTKYYFNYSTYRNE